MQKLIDQKQCVKRSMNKYEWTKELDNFLMQTVIRNYFNFDIVAIELNTEAVNMGLDNGAANIFTNDKCRLNGHICIFKESLERQFSTRGYLHRAQLLNQKTTRRTKAQSPTQMAAEFLSLDSKQIQIQEIFWNKKITKI